MSEERELRAMRRALELAEEGPAHGENPRVGCVVLGPDGAVLAEGLHRGAGTDHAEVDALRRLPAGAAADATVVVTLEPCDHTGRTGPCTAALLEAGVARVVYSVDDPGRLSGGGAERLRAAGVEVEGGVLAAEGEALILPWLTAVRRRRPYTVAKWASSLDGRVAAADGSSRWVTGAASRQHVHELRAASDAVLVGTGTVLADDPSLTARGDGGELLAHQPRPVVVGASPVPQDAAVRRHPLAPLFLADHDPAAVLATLFEEGVRRLLVEAGPRLLSALVGAGLVDEYRVYLAPSLLGGPFTALDDVGVATIGGARRLTVTGLERLGHDILVCARPAAPATEGGL